MGGNPVSFLFSITGGLFSTLVMVLLWRNLSQHISIVNISIIGAVCHNLGQLLVASWLAHELLLYSLLPILMISAVITGYVVGVVTKRVYKSLQVRQVNIGTRGTRGQVPCPKGKTSVKNNTSLQGRRMYGDKSSFYKNIGGQ
nr:Gx transporter family protein [Desulforamulus aquiferis]